MCLEQIFYNAIIHKSVDVKYPINGISEIEKIVHSVFISKA